MELLKVWFDTNWNLQIYVNKWLIIFALIVLVIWLIYLKFFNRLRCGSFEIEGAEIGIKESKIKIKPNYDDIQIAYKLWVELSTRKIGLPIDFENDVVSEVYNSWYEFFRITRELIKNIPVSKIRKNESTKKLVNIAIDVLNEGLRPHLTRWQAKFRKWHEIESKKNENITPQELQKKYPEFTNLAKEMQEVNKKLMRYREILKELAIEG